MSIEYSIDQASSAMHTLATAEVVNMVDDLNQQFVEVYRARNAPQAHLLRGTLEEAGIAVRIEGELLQGLAGELPMGWASAPRVLVEAPRAAGPGRRGLRGRRPGWRAGGRGGRPPRGVSRPDVGRSSGAGRAV